MRTTLIKSTYLDYYKKKQPITLIKHFNKLKEKPFNRKNFGYSASMSSVFSSMIEGNKIDFDTYLKYYDSGMNTKSKSFKEIEDLIRAYEFANKSNLNKINFLKSHTILSKTLISDINYRGKVRDKDVGVWGGGIKVYSGAPKEIVKSQVDLLFKDIKIVVMRLKIFNLLKVQ